MTKGDKIVNNRNVFYNQKKGRSTIVVFRPRQCGIVQSSTKTKIIILLPNGNTITDKPEFWSKIA